MISLKQTHLLFITFLKICHMITWMKRANNFQIAKAQSPGDA